MQKRRKLLIWGAGALLAILLVTFSLVAYQRGHAQPAYAGHRLSYWVEILGSRESTELQKVMATKAVEHIGPAAAPFLVEWIQEKPTKWTERRTNLYDLAIGAWEAFRILGSRAASADRALFRVTQDPNRTAWSEDRAMLCLYYLRQDPPQPKVERLYQYTSMVTLGGASSNMTNGLRVITPYHNVPPPPPGEK
jgi:hypothetical protein